MPNSPLFIQDITLTAARALVPEIPTLDDVFDLIDRELVINIEVKIPRDPKIQAKYKTNLLISVLRDKILEYGEQNVFVSSFDHEWLKNFQKKTNTPTIYLH